MGYDSFKVFKELFPDLKQEKEVIFFGGLDKYSFDVTYKLYRLKIQHEFVMCEDIMSLQVINVRNVKGFHEIMNYLDSFRYVWDIS